MLFKNIKGAFHIDKIILIGSVTAIFGMIATVLGINTVLSFTRHFKDCPIFYGMV